MQVTLSLANFDLRCELGGICVTGVTDPQREVTGQDLKGGYWQHVHIHSKCCFTKDLRSSSTDLIIQSSQSSPAPSNHCSSGDPTQHKKVIHLLILVWTLQAWLIVSCSQWSITHFMIHNALGVLHVNPCLTQSGLKCILLCVLFFMVFVPRTAAKCWRV